MTHEEREARLVELQTYEYVQQSYKRMDINNYPTLVDACQYWDGGEPTEYFIAMQPYNENFQNICLMKEDSDGCIWRVVAVRYVLDVDIKKVTKDLWMSSQHLFIKDFDGRNVPWTNMNMHEWLQKKYKNHITIVIDTEVKKI